METLLNSGLSVNIFFQQLGSWLKTPMDLFSFLGNEYFFLLLLPTLYWCIEGRTGLQVGIVLLLSLSLNDALKMTLHGPRPYWYSADIIRYAEETSFGVPSGHSQNSVAIWGVLAARIRKWWSWLIAILVIVLVGISRLYLGVHFPHDVLAGWLIGILLLCVVLGLWKPVTTWAKGLSFPRQVLAAFIASLLIFLVSFIPYFWLKSIQYQPPAEWASFATQAISLEGGATAAGTLFGLLAGLAWIDHQGGFSTQGTFLHRLMRFLLGVIGTLVIYAGLKALFGMLATETQPVLFNFLRYVRYFMVGAWVAAGAPWSFIRLKWAQPAR